MPSQACHLNEDKTKTRPGFIRYPTCNNNGGARLFLLSSLVMMEDVCESGSEGTCVCGGGCGEEQDPFS